MDSHARLQGDLFALLRQHCRFCDLRHLVLLAWMVAGLLLSQSVCFDRWKHHLPLGGCLAASWQRRCQRLFANRRIDGEALYGPLVVWAIQHWQKPGQSLHLALATQVSLYSQSLGVAIAQTTYATDTSDEIQALRQLLRVA